MKVLSGIFAMTGVAASLCAGPASAAAGLDRRVHFSIDAQSLDTALLAYARQSGVQVIAASAILHGRRAPAVRARMAPLEALEALLAGTGLSFEEGAPGTVTIVPPSRAPARAEPVRVEAAERSPDSAPPATPEVYDVDGVVVTGSRLVSRTPSPTPVSTIALSQIEERAPGSISDVVNELPPFRQSITNTQSQRVNGNGGQNRIDLRGLGDVRTLVLIDGRRHVPTNLTGTVDINLIPTLLVKRVEVVTAGASAAYGSDAVSGVVNFVLKDRIEGVEGGLQYGRSARNDNIEPVATLAAGHSWMGGRLRAMAAAEWSDNDGVGTLYHRAWGRKQPGILSFGTLETRGGLPAQGLGEGITYALQTAGGVVTSGPLRGTAFGPGGQPFNLTFGTVHSNVMIGGNNGPDASPFGNWKLLTPHERYNGLARVTYEFGDHLSAFAEYGYSHQDADALTTYHQSPNIVVPIDNPFLPASVRSAMLANGLTQISVGRYDTEFGGYRFNIGTNTERGTLGLKGKLFGDWQWDLYFDHGVTKGWSTLFTNFWEGNWLAATYVVAGPDGRPVCGPIATNPNLTGAAAARIPQIQPGCQPFNIFGRNSASEAAKDYVRGEAETKTRYEQNVLAANLRGEPFSTWAGPVSLALGLEHRRQAGSSLANAFGQLQAGLTNNGQTFSGRVKVTEGYAEAGVPLARDMRFARAIDLNGAIRRTDYSTSGAVTTWKVGATWDLDPDLRFRFTRSRDIRAANINELFATPIVNVTANAFNPINSRTGILFAVGGGNPALTPEKADSVTAGFVFQPAMSWMSDLRVSLDYYRVDIKDVIVTVPATEILRRCMNGLPDYCAMVDFDDSAFGVRQVRMQPANLNQLRTQGLDLEVAWRAPLERLGLPGRLDLRSFTTHVWELRTIDAVSRVNRAGAGTGVPGWVSNLTLSYQLGPVTNALQFRYNSRFKGDATLIGPEDEGYSPALSNSTNKNSYPSVVYVNWTGQVELLGGDARRLQLYAVVNNLMDRDPPATAIIGLINGGNPYDVVGRSFKLGLRFRY
jgi:outer membrane receptor protein involved in Fe transport